MEKMTKYKILLKFFVITPLILLLYKIHPWIYRSVFQMVQQYHLWILKSAFLIIIEFILIICYKIWKKSQLFPYLFYLCFGFISYAFLIKFFFLYLTAEVIFILNTLPIFASLVILVFAYHTERYSLFTLITLISCKILYLIVFKFNVIFNGHLFFIIFNNYINIDLLILIILYISWQGIPVIKNYSFKLIKYYNPVLHYLVFKPKTKYLILIQVFCTFFFLLNTQIVCLFFFMIYFLEYIPKKYFFIFEIFVVISTVFLLVFIFYVIGPSLLTVNCHEIWETSIKKFLL